MLSQGPFHAPLDTRWFLFSLITGCLLGRARTNATKIALATLQGFVVSLSQ